MVVRQVLQQAQTFGFYKAKIINMAEVPFDSAFRKYCEDNRCGEYNANYSCPPMCGSPEAMERRLRVYKRALVLQTKWDLADYQDQASVRKAENSHNIAMIGLIDNMRRGGHNGVMCGASCCSLCEACEMRNGRPCLRSNLKFSCMSAYCIHVKKLAEQCGMEYSRDDRKLMSLDCMLSKEGIVLKKWNYQ